MEATEGIEGNLHGTQVDSALDSKVVEMVGHFQQFKFDIATQRGKQMVGLGAHRLVGERSKEAFCLSDLWYSSTFHRL